MISFSIIAGDERQRQLFLRVCQRRRRQRQQTRFLLLRRLPVAGRFPVVNRLARDGSHEAQPGRGRPEDEGATAGAQSR